MKLREGKRSSGQHRRRLGWSQEDESDAGGFYVGRPGDGYGNGDFKLFTSATAGSMERSREVVVPFPSSTGKVI